MASPDKTPTPQKKNLFDVAPNKTPLLLFPADSAERDRVIEKLMELGYNDPDQLPKIARDHQIKLKRLSPSHVIFTAVCVSRGVDLRKQPIKHELVVSPPIDCAKYAPLDNDNEMGDVGIEVVDEVQKHVRPFVASLTEDRTLRIMGA